MIKLVVSLLVFMLFIEIVKGACNDSQKKYCTDFLGEYSSKSFDCSAHSGSSGLGYSCTSVSDGSFKISCSGFQDKCTQLCNYFKLNKVDGEYGSLCNNEEISCTCSNK